jgi:hypothetical protein
MIKKSLEQEKIFEEIKNGTSNILINAKAGTGKCLGKDTDVIKFDGSRVKVQDIKEGDLLMGDDGTPRTILSTSVGKGKLYKVEIPLTGEFFICNSDHILTCSKTYSLINPIDIPIEDAIDFKNQVNKNLYLYRHPSNFNETKKNIDYYKIGCNFFDNLYSYETIIQTSEENRCEIISGILDTYSFPQKICFKINTRFINEKNLFLTLLRSCLFHYDSVSTCIYGDFSKLNLRNKSFQGYYEPRNNFSIQRGNIYQFKISKYEENGEYYGFTLDGNGRFLINDFIVTHNTTTIVHSLDLIDKDKSIMMLAFNKHIANELKDRVPTRDNLRISTTHALGWGAIKRKYKEAVIDDDKAFKVIRKKLPRWNLSLVDDIDQYLNLIKKLVDLCRVTLTTRREFVILLAQRYALDITEEDARRVLSVMEDMLNDTKTFDFIDMIYFPAVDKKIWLFPSDYVFVDECISGRNHILIKGNSTVKIKDLYDKHISPSTGKLVYTKTLPEVLSYNIETGENEYKKIKNIYNKGKKFLSLVNLNGVYVLATPSHLFYTSEGWREVKDLKPGDLVVGNKYERELNAYSPDDEQMDFLFAYNICYGMTEYGKHRCKYRIYIKNKDKAKMKFISSITPLHIKSNKDHIKTTEFSTFKFYYNYDVFTKEYVIKNLTDKQLAIVYFLSGKYFEDINKYGFFVSLKNFDEVVYAKELFERKFNTKFDIKYYIKGNYLVPRDQDWFFNKISMYVPIIFKELIPEKFHNQLNRYKYNTTREHIPMSIVTYVKPDYKEEDVYDLEVEDNHNYFVSSLESKYFNNSIKDLNIGYLVHNCQDYNRAQQFMLNKIIKKDTGRLIAVGDENQSIYSFNGSDSEAFNWFRNKENTVELPLTTSYRSAKRIIELAQTLVPNIRYKEDAEDGEVINGSVLELAKPGDFVLARKNRPLVVLLFDLLRMNKNATIRGNDIGIKLAETVKKYKTIPELNEGLTQKLNELRDVIMNNFGVIDFRTDPRYVALEDNIEIIRYLMNNSKNIDRIIEKISLIFTDKPEGIILSNIHKSKGLEADNVFIIKPDEIRIKSAVIEANIQEKNLEYIAYTRAKKRLIIDRDWTDERI